ncbi:hypothetical protein [Methanobrevibacter arboriphilus]|uniref:Uncharacterized protein n=1 Tax=Methanobrevibacter arboriphilus TaxID=39441 RepID=A0ACA8R2J0_METAZ|nr:hypothetical protein [Methanobrevibacter arboriphilus]BBL61529.1 hypothetical protein MarbSA_05690 [Methanobrevibacter arboriphilus]
MSEDKSVISKAIEDYDKRHENTDIDKVVNTDRASKKLQTDHIKMKADELTQDDFSDDCVDSSDNKKIRNKETGICIPHELVEHRNSPVRLLETLTNNREVLILDKLQETHNAFMKAKYELYKIRGEFYSNKENWDKCKEKTGKQSDTIFKEYFQSFEEHGKLMIEREKSEFKYEQCKRVFESLLK